MVPSISKFDLGVHIFVLGANLEGQGQSAPKTNRLSGRPHATFTQSLELIQSKIQQKQCFRHPHGLVQFSP
jgi:hypothetical protein